MNQDMDEQLRYLLVLSTRGPALQIIRQPAEWSTGIPRPCSKVQSAFASTFPGTASREEPACVTDRLIVFERVVGEYETSSGAGL